MPFEIQEIDIRLRVDPNDSESVPSAVESAGKKPEAACCGPSEAEREAMVRDCVYRVLQTLEPFGQR